MQKPSTCEGERGHRGIARLAGVAQWVSASSRLAQHQKGKWRGLRGLSGVFQMAATQSVSNLQ